MIFHHKNIRLARENYVGQCWLFITLCCANRRKFFISPRICNWFLNILRRDGASHSFGIHAYCLMPDHVHLLLEGLDPASDVLQFMKAVKTKTSAPFQKKMRQPLWQKKFYDHILRHSDSPGDVAWYIWMNPVRAGICQHPNEYPFLGSFTGAWPKTQSPSSSWSPPWHA
jgi:putative transposase